jgi:hypothetical protein
LGDAADHHQSLLQDLVLGRRLQHAAADMFVLHVGSAVVRKYCLLCVALLLLDENVY